MKRILKIALALSLSLSMLTACGKGGGTKSGGNLESLDEMTIRVAVANSENFPATLGVKEMKRYIESQSKGKIKVDIFANGQLGGEEDTMEQVINNTLEMCVGSIAPLGVHQNKFYVFDIPFLFSNYNEAWMVLDSHIGTDLLGELESTGLKGLAYLENGFRHVSNNTRPINSVEDYKGLKLRTMQNENHIKAFEALGSNPTPVPFTELYMALSQKVVEGQENPLANVIDLNLFEVQKYVSLTSHVYDALPLLCNNDWWKALPVEYREIIASGALYGQNYSRFCNAERETLIINILKEKGMEVNEISPEAHAAIKAVATPAVSKLVEEKLGKEYVDKFLAEIEVVKSDIPKGLELFKN